MILLTALLATTGCGDDDEDIGNPLAPSGIAPADTASGQSDASPAQVVRGDLTGLVDGARAATIDKNTIDFSGVSWSWNSKQTHLEPSSLPDARVQTGSNVWRRDDGTGLIRIFSDADLAGMSFSTAGGSWPLSMRRAGLYVSGITGTEVDQISSGSGGNEPRNGPRNGPRNEHPALQCWPSDTSRAPRLAAESAYAGTVSFVITITCNREVDGSTEENAIRAAAGTAAHFYTAVPDASKTPPWSQGTTDATWVTKTPASVDVNTSGTSGMIYAVSIGFSFQRNETGSLRAGHLVWDPMVPSGMTKPTLTARLVQQAAAEIECTLPTVRSFSARAVDPRHNRITWSLPGQSSSCEYTALQLDVVTPSRSSVVQISPPVVAGQPGDLTTTEYIHGALPTCPEQHCGALTEDEAVVTYKIRTTDFGNHNAGPWSREVTVQRSVSSTPTEPLYLQGEHAETGHTVLTWTKPVFPEDDAGLTYSFQVSRTGTSGWRNFTAGTLDHVARTFSVSYADLQPSTSYWFRVRATHNGRSGPWSAERAEAHVHTWPAPERVEVRLSRVKGTGSDFGVGTHGRVELVFSFGEHDSHIRGKYGTGTAAGCEISVGNRSSYRPSATVTGLDCKQHHSTDARRTFNGLKLEWSQALPVNQTIWIRFALTRGTIKGPTQEIDITRNSDDEIVSRNADPPHGSGPVPTPEPCVGTSTNPCHAHAPNEPASEVTIGRGSLTVRWTTGGPGYSYGANAAGTQATRITRMDMKYEACPKRWSGGRFTRIGPAVGQSGTNCRTGTGTGRSTGTMTFRGSFGIIDGHQVDVWDVKMSAMVTNNLGVPSAWVAWTGGHVTQD